jgi:hypothetical protein
MDSDESIEMDSDESIAVTVTPVMVTVEARLVCKADSTRRVGTRGPRLRVCQLERA